MKIIPYEKSYRDDMIYMILHSKDALGRIPSINDDLLTVEDSYLKAGDMFWLAVENGRVIGCIGYQSVPGTTEVFLHRFYVKPERKRQGIGSLLLETAENDLRKKRKTVVRAHLGEPKEQWVEAYSFYPKHGYTEYEPQYMMKKLSTAKESAPAAKPASAKPAAVRPQAAPAPAPQTAKKPEQPLSLYDTLLASLKNGEESVTIPYDCRDTLFDTFRQMCGEHPELFWLDGGGSLRAVSRGTQVSVTLTPSRTMEAAELTAARTALSKAVTSALRGIPKDASDYDKVLLAHDYLVENTEYDHAALERFTASGGKGSLGISANAYGCLVKHTCVCSGYSAAFRLLMNELKVPCLTVTGSDKRNGVPHAWNCVQLDGDWYYIDVTWDDPTYAENAAKHGINHDCFLITTAELLQTHSIGADQKVPDCTAVKYNYYVKNYLTLPSYSLEAAAAVIKPQIGKEEILLKFPDAEKAQAACEKLFQGQELTKIIPKISSIRYSVGRTGVLSIWVS